MLSHLSIKGLAIIEELSIDFSQGLNVITGETGAGKSILIKALNLVLGGKAQADIIRNGWSKANVVAVFELERHHLFFGAASEKGLSIDSDEQLIIRRQVSRKGRSQAWINDVPVTQTTLKQLGLLLIDIFGQHDNHLLLDPQNHCSYVDKFIEDTSLLPRYQESYRDAHDKLRDLYRKAKEYQHKLRDRDYIEFRLRELNAFDPQKEEFANISSTLEQSKDEIEQRRLLSEVEKIIDHSYKGKGLSHAFHEINAFLLQIEDAKGIDALLAEGQDIEGKIDDFSYHLGKKLSSLDLDEESIRIAQERLNKYKDLFKKLNVQNVDQLLKVKEEFQEDLNFLDEAKQQLEDLLHQLNSLSIVLQSQGEALRDERRKTFDKLAKRIKRELQQLNMKGAELCLEMEEYVHYFPDMDDGLLPNMNARLGAVLEKLSHCGPLGLDRVQFLLRSNLGEDAKPLAKIASGGEIARIMLGIKKVLSVDAQTCVMVFDEIDTGISGQTASIVGQKLADISRQFQVICISHLPQVAVFGSTHFKVEKKTGEGRTESRIYKLNQKSSLEEVARLLSGGKITKSSLENAVSLRREVDNPLIRR